MHTLKSALLSAFRMEEQTSYHLAKNGSADSFYLIFSFWWKENEALAELAHDLTLLDVVIHSWEKPPSHGARIILPVTLASKVSLEK